MAYLNMARAAAGKGDLSEKQKYLGELKEQLHDMPVSILLGMFFMGMGMDERILGNYGTAKRHLEDGLNIFRLVRNKNFQNVVRSELGHVARQVGDLDQARKIYRETIRVWQDLGNRPAIAHQLECFAFIALVEEEPERALRLFGAAEALRARVGAQMSSHEQIEYDQAVAQLPSLLKEADFNSLWAEGRALTMEQAIELAVG